MPKRGKKQLQTPRKKTRPTRPYALQRSLQLAIVDMYNCFKKEDDQKAIKCSDTEIIVRIAGLVGHGFSAVQKVILRCRKGELLVTPGKHRKRRFIATGVDDFAKDAIARFIYSKLDRGEAVSASNVFDHLKENYETYFFEGSLRSVRRILRDMEFVWSKEDSFAHIRESDIIRYKRTCFVREYVRNLQSDHPKPVVFLNETWIFMNGSPTYSWNKPGKSGDVRGVLRRPVSEGGRLVIVHAGTKEGFVPGADLIFASDLKRDQDYHGAMNSDTFQQWVEKQLIFGLRTIGDCIIVMDNASYHSKVVEQQPTTKWRKDQLLSWLRQNGVVPPEKATKVELQTLCSMNRNHLKRYVVDEMLQNAGHIVLRLPPYHSTCNAIELVWSVAKQYYNKTVASKPGQRWDRAKSVRKEALERVTDEIWRNEVQHTEKIIMEHFDKEVRNLREVADLVICHGGIESEEETDTVEEEDDDEELAVPL